MNRPMTRRIAKWSLYLGALFGAGAAQAATCGATGVFVQVLGSGGPEMMGRASSSYLVWIDGKARVLIDAGGGSALRFGESGARMADLDAVVISHFHSDHSADFPVLVKSAHFEPRKRPLPFFGPPGTGLIPSASEFVRGLFDPKTGLFRYLGPAGNEITFEVMPQDVALGDQEVKVIFTNPALSISATPVIHAKIPALAYRVDVRGKRIVFTGDTNGNNGNLERIGAQADLFIAHHAIDDSLHFGERSLHMPPELIGRIAAAAAVKSLVMSHRRPETLGKENATRAILAREYAGPVAFANDLDCYALPGTAQ